MLEINQEVQASEQSVTCTLHKLPINNKYLKSVHDLNEGVDNLSSRSKWITFDIGCLNQDIPKHKFYRTIVKYNYKTYIINELKILCISVCCTKFSNGPKWIKFGIS